MQHLKSMFLRILEVRPEPKFPKGRVPCVPIEDSAEMLTDSGPEPSIGYAEGQTFAIEYEAASGELSERRITVWSIKQGANGVPCLLAKCHERKATRQFRIDRIQAVIDLDGEVHEPPTEFFIENFGMDPVFAEAAETGVVDLPEIKEKLEMEALLKARWASIKEKIYWEVKALSALAWSDGEMHVEERGVILDYLHEQLTELDLTDDEDKRLCDYVKRQYPSPTAVQKAIDEIWLLPDERKRSFVRSCARLIEADGKVAPEELKFLEESGFRIYH